MARKSHRSFFRLMQSTVVVLLLAACGNTESANQGASPAAPNTNEPQATGSPQAPASPAQSPGGNQGTTSGQAVTLRYGFWNQNQAPALEEIIAEFKKSNPNIDVQLEVTPFDQYWTKLEAAATGSSAPDLFWMNGPNFIKYASNEILMPLNERIEADGVDLGNYPESLVELYTHDEIQYALPKDFDTIGLWYNKELFDAAGVEHPDETWSWDTVREAAEQLTNVEEGVWGIAARMINQEGFYNTIYQNGGYVIAPDGQSSGYDNPDTIAGLKFWTDLVEQGVSPTHAQMTETNPLDLFQSGKVAMLYGGSWRQVQFAENEFIKDKVDVAVLPQGQQRAVVIHGLGHVVSANTAHPEEAWEFLKFLGGQQAAEIQARTGTVLPAFNGAQELWVQSNPQYNLQVFLDQLEYAVPYPVSENTAEWQQLEQEHFAQAWSGQMNVEDAAQQVAQGMNQILEQE